MPAIPDYYLECVVFLYQSEKHALKGNTEGGGTGFFVRVPLWSGGPQNDAVYIVTNKHCARHCPTLRLRTKNNEWRYITPTRKEWLDHPDGDDLSAYAVELGPDFATPKGVTIRAADTREQVSAADIEHGADVFFAGRYTTLSGIAENTPMLRFGNLAMMPTPIDVGDGSYQESFLVEARSRGGFSGSPVFGYSLHAAEEEFDALMFAGAPARPPRASDRTTEVRNIVLLGVVWGHLPDWEPVYGKKDRHSRSALPGHWVTHNSNLACVVPAWKIDELLSRKEFQAMRGDLREQRQATSAAQDFTTDEQSEFERFEDLTRRLVNVPKKELEEKRKDEG